MESIPNLVTKKFVLEVERLIEKGVAANYAEIASTIDWHKSSMSQVIKGKINVPVAVYRKFVDHYNLLPPEHLLEKEGAGESLAGLRADFLKDDLIAALKESNQLLKQQLDIHSVELRRDIKVNAGMLACVIDLLLLVSSENKTLHRKANEVLEKRKLKGIVN